MSFSSLSTSGASSLNLEALAIDDDATLRGSMSHQAQARSGASSRYSPAPLRQAHHATARHSSRCDCFHEAHFKSSVDVTPERETKLVRRPGWGSVDTRRAYNNLSALATLDRPFPSSKQASSAPLPRSNSASALGDLDDRAYMFDADDWGYFVDTRP
jgi:hypothetical protein